MGKVKNTLALIGTGYVVYEAAKYSPTIMNYMDKLLPYAQKVVEKTVEEIPKILKG